MRNLMLASLAIFFVAWWALQSFGNAGLWSALIASYVSRGGLQAARYPAQFRKTFPKP
jgi:multidrug resistance protein, MATE family